MRCLLLGLALSLVSASGCTANLCNQVRELPGEANVLAVGDSVLAWNAGECQSVIDHLALTRGAAAINRSVSGATLLPSDNASIPTQYVEGEWDWVVIDGGGNDLNSRCDCGACDAVLDDLVSEDGSTGAMAQLVDRALDDGARVLLLGYYDLPDGALWGFDDCDAPFDELDARYEALAAQREGVLFFPLEQVVTPADEEAYAFDKVHPSTEGSRRIGEALAAVIEASGENTKAAR